MQARAVVTVTFTYDKTPQSPQLTVAAGERVMTPAADDTYRLPVGYSYSWSFRSANYAKQTGTIDLTSVTEGGAQTIAVALLDKTAWRARATSASRRHRGRHLSDHLRQRACVAGAGGKRRARGQRGRRALQRHRPRRRGVDAHRQKLLLRLQGQLRRAGAHRLRPVHHRQRLLEHGSVRLCGQRHHRKRHRTGQHQPDRKRQQQLRRGRHRRPALRADGRDPQLPQRRHRTRRAERRRHRRLCRGRIQLRREGDHRLRQHRGRVLQQP